MKLLTGSPCRTVAEVARLFGGRLPCLDVAVPGVGGEAVRVGNGSDRERGDLLLAAHLPLLDSAAARRRTLHNTAASPWRHLANTIDGSGL